MKVLWFTNTPSQYSLLLYESPLWGDLKSDKKNILILPDIARNLLSNGLYFKVTVVGDGPHRSNLEEKIKRMNLENVFEMFGELERDAAREVFSKAHFPLLPSNFEGFGLVVAEAMAAGSIPIVSDIPVFRWILGVDSSTLVSPVKDAKGYAERIRMLAADPERYRQIQGRLQRRQQEKFSPESTVNGYLNLIEELSLQHNPERFTPVPLERLPIPKYHRRRFSRAWWLLQKVRYRL